MGGMMWCIARMTTRMILCTRQAEAAGRCRRTGHTSRWWEGVWVLRYERRIRTNARAFYDYYAWQVYVRTPAGLRRITGPR